MKKMVWLFVGVVVVAGVVLLASRAKRSKMVSGAEMVIQESGSRTQVASLVQMEESKGAEASGAIVKEAYCSPKYEGTLISTIGDSKEIVLPNNEDAAATKKELSDAIQTITRPDATYNERLAAMRQLTQNILPDDIAALMEFLGTPTPDGLAMRPIEYDSIKNDIMEILLQQAVLPEGIGQLLVDIYNSPDHDEIWRNYSIQFMAPFYERQAKDAGGSGSVPASQNDSTLQLVKDSLWKALDERNNSNAGTALLGLDDLSDRFSEFAKPEVQAAMVDLAKDGDASEANRITALRLCGQQGLSGALDAARDVAQHGETTVLRCAAIATLGDLGGEEEKALLEGYASSSDPRIQRIAIASLSKLTSK